MLYEVLGGCAALAAIAARSLNSANSRLAVLEARCDTAFADIDVHLKRRQDLIPGLVECVRGFAAHESSLLKEVVQARVTSLQAAPAMRDQAEAVLGRKVGAVFSLAEKYPDLAASPHFRELRQELVMTEERIAAARRFYNLAIGEFNATRQQFPASLIASQRRIAQRRPYDLGVERVLLDDGVAIQF